MTAYTARELGIMAYAVDTLTQRRKATPPGRPVPPDTVAIRLGAERVGLARWEQGTARNGAAPWRYTLDPEPTPAALAGLPLLTVRGIKNWHG